VPIFHNRNLRRPRFRPATSLIEEALTNFSARLTIGVPDQVDRVIESGLLDLLNVTGAGCISWYEKDSKSPALERVYSTDKSGNELLPHSLTNAEIPYTFETLMNGRPLLIQAPDDLPAEASQDREFFRKSSIWGLILTSSDCATQCKGVLAVAYLPTEPELTANLVAQLTVLNNLITTSTERKRVYELWHESENRFRFLFHNAPIGIAIENLRGELLFVNPALRLMLGLSDKELIGKRCSDLSVRETNTEDDMLLERLRNGAIDHYRTEKQFIHRDGTRIWGRVDVALLRNGTEIPLVICMVEDITDRKHADDQLRKTRTELEQLAEHLIQAQEDERHRISRELHDDIAQRLSLLAIELETLRQSLANAGCDKELEQIAGLKTETDELANDVHLLSHQLHSARLQHLGLRSAIEELTKQISRQHQISIHMSTYGRDTLLPPDVALCLFRVTQEALNNAVRHSKAQFVFIELSVDQSVARLQIRDTGVGFDIATCTAGIGLVNMRERLRMIRGDFSVESRVGMGTVVSATVPLSETLMNNKVA